MFETHWHQQEILLFFPLRPSLSPSFSLSSQRNFPNSFKPKVAIARFEWKMQRKTWYSILGLDAKLLPFKLVMLSFVKKSSVLKNLSMRQKLICYTYYISKTCTQSLLVTDEPCQGRITCAVCVNILVIE